MACRLVCRIPFKVGEQALLPPVEGVDAPADALQHREACLPEAGDQAVQDAHAVDGARKAVRVQEGYGQIGGCLEVLGLALEHGRGPVLDHAPVKAVLGDGAELLDHVRQFGIFGLVARVFACRAFSGQGTAYFGNQFVGHWGALHLARGGRGACGERWKCRKKLWKSRGRKQA